MGKEEFTKELLRYGDIKSCCDTNTASGKQITIRIIKYDNQYWYHRMENGNTIKLYEI